MPLPSHNATLTSIAPDGYTADWTSTATTAAATWTGTADAWVRDDRRNVYTNGAASTVVERTVVLPSNLTVNIGDTLTLVWKGATITPQVKGVVRREPPAGIAGSMVVEIEVT